MKLAYFIAIAVILVVLGMLFFPSLHLSVGNVTTTGWLPLTIAAKTFLPYAFLLFVIYGVFRMARR